MIAFWLWGVTAAPAAFGANLISNGNFDVDLSGWFVEPGTAAVWTSDDSQGNPSSGSAHVTGQGAFAMRIDSDCFPVTAETTYDASVWMRLALGSTQTGRLTLLTYSNDGCHVGGYLGAQDATPDATQTGAWELLQGQVTTPATAQSGIAKCELGGETAVDAECDGVFLPEPANAGRWALASLGLLVLARRRAARG